MNAKLIVIGGPTASGKTDLSIALAKELNAQIVIGDSMQVYRGMDIGTAKPTLKERAGIKHHLIDALAVTQELTVAWYQENSRRIIDELLAQGINVVVVGGTGLYLKALLDDLDFPDSDLAVRSKLAEDALKIGSQAMHERLAKLDPAAAIAIPHQNVRRVIRALEVIEITGKPFTARLPRVESTRYPEAKQFAIDLPRPLLDQRILQRCEKMFAQDFVGEVAELVKQGLPEGKTARAAIGYAELLRHLNGEIDLATARNLTEIATRQYARRQITWFARDARITWLKETNLAAQLEAILQQAG